MLNAKKKFEYIFFITNRRDEKWEIVFKQIDVVVDVTGRRFKENFHNDRVE